MDQRHEDVKHFPLLLVLALVMELLRISLAETFQSLYMSSEGSF